MCIYIIIYFQGSKLKIKIIIEIMKNKLFNTPKYVHILNTIKNWIAKLLYKQSLAKRLLNPFFSCEPLMKFFVCGYVKFIEFQNFILHYKTQ